MNTPSLSLIVACTKNGVIGQDQTMPWHLPADLKHFKTVTTNKPIVMGRKTFESIGRPLPNRHNIIITRDPNYQAEGCTVVKSPEDAVIAAGDVAEIMIIGGGEIFNVFMGKATSLYLTEIDTNLNGDTFFEWQPNDWELIEEQHRPADENNAYNLNFKRFHKQSRV